MEKKVKNRIPLTSSSQFKYFNKGGNKKISILVNDKYKKYEEFDVVDVDYSPTIGPSFVLKIWHNEIRISRIEGVVNRVISYLVWGNWLKGKDNEIGKYPHDILI